MKTIAVASLLAGLLAMSGSAQVNERKQNQQDRIAQGVQSGQMTPGEASRVENQERAINGEEHADKAADGGKLTSAERQKINNQQNRESQRIYNDKHNANTDHFGKGEVGQRERNQQDRIAQGMRSDKLNAGQASNLERRDAGINGEVKADRAANGGHLTGSEKAQVNRQQNRTSRAIYRDKH